MAVPYVPYEGPIVTRAEAKASGARHYFPATVCRKGHLSQRHVGNGECRTCASLRPSPKYDDAKRLYWKAWRKSEAGLAHREKRREARLAETRNYRARRAASAGTHTAADVLEILRLQKGRCAYCRVKLSTSYHVDHILPIAKGGSNDRTNIQITCALCNTRKGARDPVDHARRVGLLI